MNIKDAEKIVRDFNGKTGVRDYIAASAYIEGWDRRGKADAGVRWLDSRGGVRKLHKSAIEEIARLNSGPAN